jgi:hypothetical protein
MPFFLIFMFTNLLLPLTNASIMYDNIFTKKKKSFRFLFLVSRQTILRLSQSEFL